LSLTAQRTVRLQEGSNQNMGNHNPKTVVVVPVVVVVIARGGTRI